MTFLFPLVLLPRAARRPALLCVGALALTGCAGVPATHLAAGRVPLPLKLLAVQAPMRCCATPSPTTG